LTSIYAKMGFGYTSPAASNACRSISTDSRKSISFIFDKIGFIAGMTPIIFALMITPIVPV
jgi:hypothetical protein